jgi:hypothetical protein
VGNFSVAEHMLASEGGLCVMEFVFCKFKYGLHDFLIVLYIFLLQIVPTPLSYVYIIILNKNSDMEILSLIYVTGSWYV